MNNLSTAAAIVCGWLIACIAAAGPLGGLDGLALLPDPTAPLHPEPIADRVETKLNLQGIFNRRGRPYAIINGAMVEPGSRIGDLTISAIDSNRVYYVGASQGFVQLQPSLGRGAAP